MAAAPARLFNVKGFHKHRISLVAMIEIPRKHGTDLFEAAR